jgi:hypothetical protein
MFNVSQTAVNAVLRDMESGNTSYVEQFFVNRPEWLENDQDDDTTEQADNQREAAEEKRS